MPLSNATSILFIATASLCYAWLCGTLWVSLGKRALIPMLLATAWVALQALLSLQGFYSNNMSVPPRFVFALAPPIIAIILLCLYWPTRKVIIALPIFPLLLLHSIRLPVEIGLWGLYKAGLVPQLMTFEGGNWDILSGISAPIIALLWIQGSVGNRALLVWNLVTLALLFNIVMRAILTLQTPFQKFAFDQPNLGVTLFPFILLPVFIVPLVFFSHMAVIFHLWMDRKYGNK